MLTLETGNYLSKIIYLILSYLIFIGPTGFFNALVGYLVGDTTSEHEEKLTLNPLAHVDPFGFICLLLIGIGWSQRSPINLEAIDNPYRKFKIGFALCAEALFSFIMGTICTCMYYLLAHYSQISSVEQANSMPSILAVMLRLSATISIFFMFYAMVCAISSFLQVIVTLVAKHSYHYASLLARMSPIIVLLIFINYGHIIQSVCMHSMNTICLVINQFLTLS